MNQTDITEVVLECILLAFLFIVIFSLLGKKKLFNTPKSRYFLQTYFIILVLESIDRIYHVEHGVYLLDESYTNFSFADTFFFLFLAENILIQKKYFRTIIIAYILLINLFYLKAFRWWFLTIDYIFNIALLIYVFRALNKYLKGKSKRFLITNRFITNFSFVILFFMAFSYVTSFSVNTLQLFVANYQEYANSINMVIVPFWLITFLYLLQFKVSFRFREVSSFFSLKKKPRRNVVRFTETEAETYKLVVRHVLEKKSYLNSKLNLESLAIEVGVNEKYLSKLINHFAATNFNDFINKFRLEAFKQNLEKKEFQNYSILGMALEAGFSSKSTFYKAFKRHESISPKEYIERGVSVSNFDKE